MSDKHRNHRYRRHRASTCELCGGTDSLEAHHVDFDPTHNWPGNIKTLCRRCHVAFHDRIAGLVYDALELSAIRRTLAIADLERISPGEMPAHRRAALLRLAAGKPVKAGRRAVRRRWTKAGSRFVVADFCGGSVSTGSSCSPGSGRP